MTRRPSVLLIALGLGLSACGGGGGGGAGAGASASSFCSLIKSDAKEFANAGSDSRALSAFEKLESTAPNDIKPDMKTLVSFVKDVSAKHLPSASDLTKIESATTNIEAYVKDKCKFDLTKG